MWPSSWITVEMSAPLKRVSRYLRLPSSSTAPFTSTPIESEIGVAVWKKVCPARTSSAISGGILISQSGTLPRSVSASRRPSVVSLPSVLDSVTSTPYFLPHSFLISFGSTLSYRSASPA